MYIFGISLLYNLLIIIAIIVLGIVANLFSKKISQKYDLMDYPSDSVLKIQKKPTPLSGGMAIFFTLTIVLFLLAFVKDDFTNFGLTLSLLSVLFFSVVTGILDDLGRLPAKIRLSLYILFAGTVIIILREHLVVSIFVDFLAIFIFAPGIITSVNMIDGMDGLCASLSIISFIAFLVLGFKMREFNQMLVFLSFAGILSTIPFLFFNFNPAKIFLGSSGSELIGLLFFILVMLSMKNTAGSFLLTRILLIGIPVMDMCRVMIIRIMAKKSVMSGDRNHIYDVLSHRGFGQKKVWIIMVIGQSVVVAVALFLNIRSY